MLDKLEAMSLKFDELGEEIARPEIIAQQDVWRKKVQEYAALEEIMAAYQALLRTCRQLADAQAMLQDADPDLREMAHEEFHALKKLQEEQEQAVKILLLPKDPDDGKNALLEIRAGTGGEEASLFGMDLLKMYTKYAERNGWQFELIALNDTELGGVKEAVCLVSGKDVFSKLKYESGVHRVQRVPETESSGRIHTSAATVAVLPESQDIEININPQELRIDTFRSGGAGGQHINKTESAIRITHLPTGIVVVCQDERSQMKNRDKAMRVLKARLRDHFEGQASASEAAKRRAQVGSGDRSERIRTYNFPQGRVTDHRINVTLYHLDDFLSGNCDSMITPLLLAEQAALLSAQDNP